MPLRVRPLAYADIPATLALKSSAFRAHGRLNEAMLPLGRTEEIAERQVKNEQKDWLEMEEVKRKRLEMRGRRVDEGGSKSDGKWEEEYEDVGPGEIIELVVWDEEDGHVEGGRDGNDDAHGHDDHAVRQEDTSTRPGTSTASTRREMIALAYWELIYHAPSTDTTMAPDSLPPPPALAAEATPTIRSSEPQQEQTAPVAEYNRELMRIYEETTAAAQREVMKGVERYWNLIVLATSPLHPRRGAASLLLQWGINLAEAQNLPIYLDSTEIAKRLYEKHGFEVRKVDEIDLGRWGIEGDGRIDRNYGMVRVIKSEDASLQAGE